MVFNILTSGTYEVGLIPWKWDIVRTSPGCPGTVVKRMEPDRFLADFLLVGIEGAMPVGGDNARNG